MVPTIPMILFEPWHDLRRQSPAGDLRAQLEIRNAPKRRYSAWWRCAFQWPEPRSPSLLEASLFCLSAFWRRLADARRGDERSGSLFSYVDLEARVGQSHPLRAIRALADEALAALVSDFSALDTSSTAC
jgi:hypothetical protein